MNKQEKKVIFLQRKKDNFTYDKKMNKQKCHPYETS